MNDATHRLILLRHAKSAWDTGDPDFDRPLAPRGHRDARRIGRWLAGQAYSIDRVCCSPARRALQTCELALNELPVPPPVERVARIYEAGRNQLLSVLAAIPAGCGCALLIGHNPGLDGLLQWLLPTPPARTDKGKLMTTAAVAVLECRGRWDRIGRGSASLEALVRPKELSARER